jgi:hypothetical protein
MQSEVNSLRWLVEKWLPSAPATPLRMTRYGRANSSQIRIVRVQTSGTAMPFAIFFFRHDDGAWRVFPPAPGHLTVQRQ